jgi:hypothetical protein
VPETENPRTASLRNMTTCRVPTQLSSLQSSFAGFSVVTLFGTRFATRVNARRPETRAARSWLCADDYQWMKCAGAATFCHCTPAPAVR